MAYLLNKQKGNPNTGVFEHTHSNPRSVTEGSGVLPLQPGSTVSSTGHDTGLGQTPQQAAKDPPPVQASPDFLP